ncbi:hypothetical protein GUJ93_ZPchr0004g38139 [Zizania palustris]|uniref:Uncharacterized protein n=1 Tax=Zizania palustris TaxID=103762 RepID=A0A8J5VPW6_ZIZPA|nr:hypothetical protein GUJ93_ZPchr0004g38139 [Zizania palustris]
MEWWQRSVVVPVKRAWVVVSARLRRRKKEYDKRRVSGVLHDDIQMCSYEDVQVMWEMLQRSETAKLAPPPSPSPGGTARALVWLGRDDMRRRRRC